MATGTCEKEVVLAPNTGFALSTCSEVELKRNRRFKKNRGVRNWLRQVYFASETWLRYKVLEKLCPDPLPVGKFWVVKFHGFPKTLRFAAFPEFAARVASPRIHYNLTTI